MANLKVKFVTYNTAVVSFVSDVRICGQLKPTLIRQQKLVRQNFHRKFGEKKLFTKLESVFLLLLAY